MERAAGTQATPAEPALSPVAIPVRGFECDSSAPRLTVPAVFSRFQFSVIYTQLGATQGMLMDQQKSMLQAILKQFTKELSNGFVVMGIVDGDGRATEYACSVDREMTQLVMQPAETVPGLAAPRGGVAPPPQDATTAARPAWPPGPIAPGGPGCRALVFREIERICSPEEVRNLRTANFLVMDECCTTVVLAGQRFVTFRLESVAAREYLMLALQVLRMSQSKARMWYQ